METEYCYEEGAIAGPPDEIMGLFDAPLTKEKWDRGERIGCNNIRCSDCGKTVRAFPNARWKSNFSHHDIPELYEQKDLGEYLQTENLTYATHAYICGCHVRNIGGTMLMRELQMDDLRWTWGCGGH